MGWPASSPYVVAVGGTQLMDDWLWAPTSDDPSTAGYYNSIATSSVTQPVWNESWAPIATGGGASQIYARPSWQANAGPSLGDQRIVPDTSWNAAVNGGVDVLVDNQMWESPVPGYPTTSGYDATTGWGTPNAQAFVAALLTQ